jgi:hypothetical protein
MSGVDPSLADEMLRRAQEILGEKMPGPEPAISTAAELSHLRTALARRDLDLAQAMAEAARHEAAGKAMAGEMERLRRDVRNRDMEIARLDAIVIRTPESGYSAADPHEVLDMRLEVANLRARLAVVEPLVTAAARLVENARKCHDRPYMGCSMNHDTIENAIGDEVDAALAEESRR